jgi:hypothetical protein
LSYTPTQNITISYDAANHMHGEVLTYNSGTGVLTVDVNHHTGSGTYTSWVVNVGGVTPATSVAWGAITGTLSSQTDLQTALDARVATAGDTMDNNALLSFNDTTTNSNVGINGNGIVTTLAPSPSEYSQLTYNGLLLTNGADTLSLSPTAITFPDASVQTTAAVTFTGGTLSSIVAVSSSGGTASLGTDSGGSISVTDMSATTTTKVTYSGITFSDSSTQTTAAVAGANLGDAFTIGKVQDVSISSGYWVITFAPVNSQLMASGLSVSLSDGSSSESITSFSTSSTWTYTTTTLTSSDYIWITFAGQRSQFAISYP